MQHAGLFELKETRQQNSLFLLGKTSHFIGQNLFWVGPPWLQHVRLFSLVAMHQETSRQANPFLLGKPSHARRHIPSSL
jgi:hypothetical protein